MTELEELEQGLLWALTAHIYTVTAHTPEWEFSWMHVQIDCLLQSRVGAAFDQARERQARFELMGRGADSWTNERVK